MKFLRLSDKRADDNFRAGKTWGHEVMVPAKNVLREGWLKYGDPPHVTTDKYTGLNADARKFLQANGAFKWQLRRSFTEDTVMFQLAREEAALFFKLKFA